ncbi:MAG: hypothetical protein QOK42_1225 [Frankiaceae bacterium]|jgi:plastocyanin|nr:hypothetical protein [Frankiaceae bacterium]
MRRPPLVAVLALVAASACSSSSGGSKPASGAADSGAPGSAVTIQSFGYRPSPLTVTPGQKVVVTNKDGTEHTATSDKSGLFDSGDIDGGGSQSFTAPTAPGTYTYMCKYHSSMHGTLVVKG